MPRTEGSYTKQTVNIIFNSTEINKALKRMQGILDASKQVYLWGTLYTQWKVKVFHTHKGKGKSGRNDTIDKND